MPRSLIKRKGGGGGGGPHFRSHFQKPPRNHPPLIHHCCSCPISHRRRRPPVEGAFALVQPRPTPVRRLHCSALPPHQPRACSLSPALPSVEPWFSRALSSHRRPQLCLALVPPFPQPATARPTPVVPWPSCGLPWFSRALVQSECEHSALPLPAVSPASPIDSLTTDRHGKYQGWFSLQAHG